AVDAGGAAVLAGRADREDHAVARQRDARAELVAEAAVGGLDVELLRPAGWAAREQVDGAGQLRRVVALIAADAGGRAGFAERADGERGTVAGQRDAPAEQVGRAGVGGGQLGLLGPDRGVACEHVDRAGGRRDAVGAGGERRARARKREAAAEAIVGVRGRGLEVGLLAPGRA